MGRSVLQKIWRILEKPEEPAYIRERRKYKVAVPWHERFFEAIGLPAAAPNRSLTRTQRRLLIVSGVVVLLLVASGALYSYVSRAAERAQTAYSVGLTLLGPGDYKTAVTKFSQSLSIRESPDVYVERGNAYKELKESDKALADWNRAIALDPNSFLAYASRGTYYRVSGKLAEAESDLDRSIQIQPNVEAFYQRGSVFQEMGKFEDALKDFNSAIELHPEVPFLYHARATAKKALGDDEGSSEDHKTALHLETGH
jgi:tetratricopeptide (TPR) repeat protein